MDYRIELHREITRQAMEEERGRISLRSQARGARVASGERVSLRSRVSRLLVKVAFAIDPEEGWRHFWAHLAQDKAAARNPDG